MPMKINIKNLHRYVKKIFYDYVTNCDKPIE